MGVTIRNITGVGFGTEVFTDTGSRIKGIKSIKINEINPGEPIIATLEVYVDGMNIKCEKEMRKNINLGFKKRSTIFYALAKGFMRL